MDDFYATYLSWQEHRDIGEILRREGSESLIDLILQIEVAIDGKAIREGQEALTESERVVVTVEGLLREVRNGGFKQFFQNTSNQYAAYAVDSMKRLGYSNLARITAKAIDAFRELRA